MRPQSIVNFERIVIAMVLLGVVSTYLSWERLVSYAESQGFGSNFVIATQAIGLAVTLLLVWLIARKRNEIAKWVWVILIVFGLVVSIGGVVGGIETVRPSVALQALQWVLSLASLWFLFRPDSTAWFVAGRT